MRNAMRLMWAVLVSAMCCVTNVSWATDQLLHEFAGGTSDGSSPNGSLTLSNNYLYGMTYSGGTSDQGTVFRMSVNGGPVEILHNFSGSASGNPWGGTLLVDGSNIYGMTYRGGGNVFKIDTANGNAFTALHTFTGAPGDGVSPNGSLVLVGSDLYGMTEGGWDAGDNYKPGTIFKVSTSGGPTTILHYFTGAPSDGSAPVGSLTVSGSNLYGMTTTGGNGGVGDMGTIFKTDVSGSQYSVIHNFAGGTADGSYPYYSDVTAADGVLYGMTSHGGSTLDDGDGRGVVFKVSETGGAVTLLHSFVGTANDGAIPRGSLTLSGNTLYGMTSDGGIGVYGDGSEGNGTIFSVGTDGSGYTILHKFAGGANDGKDPWGNLVVSGNTGYGMTSAGGDGNLGTIFKVRLSLGPCIWSGLASGDGTWTNGNNWDWAPGTNDAILFGAAAQKTNTNNYTAGSSFGKITLNDGGYLIDGNRVTLSNGMENLVGDNTFNAPITINTTTATIKAAAGTNLTLGGAIDGTGKFITEGPGTIIRTGQGNNYGGTVVSGGKLVLAAANTLPDYYGLTIQNGGTLDIGNNNETVGAVTLTEGTIMGSGKLMTTAAEFALRNGTVAVELAGNAGIHIGSGGMPSTVTISSPCTFNGATTMDWGTLRLGANDVLPAGTSIAGGSNRYFVLDLDGHNQTVADLTGANSCQILLGSGRLTVGSGNLLGYIYGAGGSLEKVGDGTLNLSYSTLGHTGGTIITGGTLSLNAWDLGGAFQNNAVMNFNQWALDSAFTGSISGSGKVVKDGARTLTMSGSNTVAGGVDINEGKLIVSGNGNLTTFTTNSGTTLAGAGTVAGVVVNDGGTVSPGTSPGTLAMTDLTLASGGHYLWEVNGVVGTAGTEWDLMTTANLTISSTPSSRFMIDITSLKEDNTAGLVHDFVNTTTHTWTILSASNGLGSFSADKFTLNYSNFANPLNGGTFSLDTLGNDVVLKFNPDTTPVYIWSGDGGTNTNWWSGSNWQGGNAPGEGKNVKFASGGTVSLNDTQPAIVNNMIFDNTSGFSVNGSQSLTINTGITRQSASADVINVPIILGNDSLWENFNSAGSLTVNGTVDTEGKVLTVSGDGATTINGAIGDAGSLIKNGVGILTLAGGNSYSGGTTVNDGTLKGNASGIQGAITNNAAVMFDMSASGTYAGAMGGSGALIKTGAGSLTLSGSNSYEGETHVTQGALYASPFLSDVMSDASAVVLEAGTQMWASAGNHSTYELDLSDTIGSLAGAGDLYLGGSYLCSYQLTVGADGTDTVFSGQINEYHPYTDNETKAYLIKAGNGTMTLTGSSNYTGSIAVNGGTLVTAGTNALGVSSMMTVGSEGVLDMNGDDQTFVALSGEGEVLMGAGTLTLSKRDGVSTFSGKISGTGTLLLHEGTLVCGAANALPSEGVVSVEGYTNWGPEYLDQPPYYIWHEQEAFHGALDISSFDQTVNELDVGGGTPKGSYGSLNGQAEVLGTGTLTVNNVINAYGGTIAAKLSGAAALTKSTAGTLTLSNENSYEGGTMVNEGILLYGADNVLPDIGTVTINATINMVDHSDTVNHVVVNGGTLNIDQGGSLEANEVSLQQISGTYSWGGTWVQPGNITGAGTIEADLFDFQCGSASVSLAGGELVKTTDGTVTLSGTNTYSGGTTVSEGTLVMYTPSVQGNIQNNAVLVLSNTADVESIDVNSISGTGAVVTSVIDQTTMTLNGTPQYTGGTVINGAGTVALGNNNALSDGGAVTVNAGTLDIAGHQQSASTVTLMGGQISDSAGGGKVKADDYQLRSGTVNAELGERSTAASVTVTGYTDEWGNPITGDVTVKSTCSYTGPTNVTDNGRLTVDGDISSSATTVENGGIIGGSGMFGSVEIKRNGSIDPQTMKYIQKYGYWWTWDMAPCQTNTKDQVWDSGGSFVWRVSDVGGNAGDGYSFINIDGALNVNITDDKFTLKLVSSGGGGGAQLMSSFSQEGEGGSGTPAVFDPSGYYTWTIATASAGMPENITDTIELDASSWFYDANPSKLSLSRSESGTDLLLTYGLPPDPNYHIVNDFSYDKDNGAGYSCSDLTNVNGVLYGTYSSDNQTYSGGIFKVDTTANDAFMIVYQLDQNNGEGSSPQYGSMVYDDVNAVLYGTTAYGGANGNGAIFKLDPATGAMMTYSPFNYSGSEGANPYTQLTAGAGGILYGVAYNGGIDQDSNTGNGTVFSFDPATETYTPLHTFDASFTDGAYPYGQLLYDAGKLYGTTYYGNSTGTYGGTIFRIDTTNGNAYTKLWDFDQNTDGGYPYGGLVKANDGMFYGMTSSDWFNGGTGTIYRLDLSDPDNPAFDRIYAFQYDPDNGRYPEGAQPYGRLTLGPDGMLYGLTYAGGENESGAMFRINTDGTGYELIYSFNRSSGYGPSGAITLVGNYAYGTTGNGGPGQDELGVVFRYDLPPFPPVGSPELFERPVVAAADQQVGGFGGAFIDVDDNTLKYAADFGDPGSAVPIENEAGVAFHPAVSNGEVLYRKSDGYYLWTSAEGSVRVFDGAMPAYDGGCAIYNGTMVVEGAAGLFYKKPSESTWTNFAAGSANRHPSVAGDKVVLEYYGENGTKSLLKMFNLSTGDWDNSDIGWADIEVEINYGDNLEGACPWLAYDEAGGYYVAWQGWNVDNEVWNLFYWSSADPETILNLTELIGADDGAGKYYSDMYPVLDTTGSLVAFQRLDDWDIYEYSLDTGILTPVSTELGDEMYPTISGGGQVAWGNYDPSTGAFQGVGFEQESGGEVPEPSTLLLLLPLIGFGLRRKLRTAKK